MSGSVVVDCFPESVRRHRGCAIVVVDVIRATTTAVTAVSLGRRCFPVASLDAARFMAGLLTCPLLAGELGGAMPAGFDMNNSPARVAMRTDVERPLIMLSTSGTPLIEAAASAGPAIVACLRNYSATARHLTRHDRIAIIGAGSRGQFREEDQMCCAWIAGLLMESGYAAATAETGQAVERWRGRPAEAALNGDSAAYLRRTGQADDLAFIAGHIDDIDAVFTMTSGEVRPLGKPAPELEPVGAA